MNAVMKRKIQIEQERQAASKIFGWSLLGFGLLVVGGLVFGGSSSVPVQPAPSSVNSPDAIVAPNVFDALTRYGQGRSVEEVDRMTSK